MSKKCLVGVGKKSQNPNAQVLGFGELSIDITGESNVIVDENQIYTITVTNTPPDPIPAVIELDVPANATFVSASNSGTYDSETRKVTRPSANVTSGGNIQRTVTILFDELQEYTLNTDVNTTSVQPVDADNNDSIVVQTEEPSGNVEIRVTQPDGETPTGVFQFFIGSTDYASSFTLDVALISSGGGTWTYRLGYMDGAVPTGTIGVISAVVSGMVYTTASYFFGNNGTFDYVKNNPTTIPCDYA